MIAFLSENKLINENLENEVSDEEEKEEEEEESCCSDEGETDSLADQSTDSEDIYPLSKIEKPLMLGKKTSQESLSTLVSLPNSLTCPLIQNSSPKEIKTNLISGDKESSCGSPKIVDPFVKSMFPSECDVLYFPEDGEKVMPLGDDLTGGLRFKICQYTPKVVRDLLRKVGFKLVRGGKCWLGSWGRHCPSKKFKHVLYWQRINFFPLACELGRKDRLYYNMTRLQELHGLKAFSFYPKSFLLPKHEKHLEACFKHYPAWIVKPPAAARGIGVYLVNKLGQIPKKKEVIISRYISNPYTINERKFDIRIYALITSVYPLKLYLYDEGILRFASQRYSKPSRKNISLKQVHLTNYSINKHFQSKGEDTQSKHQDIKWNLLQFRKYLEERGVAWAVILDQLKDIVLKAVISATPNMTNGLQIYANNPVSCYELFGFDILIDEHLKAWLLEVNISPSLKYSCRVDHEVKKGLVRDIFNLVGMKKKDVRRCHVAYLDRKKNGSNIKLRDLNDSFRKTRHRKCHFSQPVDFCNLHPEDKELLRQYEFEIQRKGNFLKLFPCQDYEPYIKYFPSPRYVDILLCEWERQPLPKLPLLLKESYTMPQDSPNNSYKHPEKSLKFKPTVFTGTNPPRPPTLPKMASAHSPQSSRMNILVKRNAEITTPKPQPPSPVSSISTASTLVAQHHQSTPSQQKHKSHPIPSLSLDFISNSPIQEDDYKSESYSFLPHPSKKKTTIRKGLRLPPKDIGEGMLQTMVLFSQRMSNHSFYCKSLKPLASDELQGHRTSL